MHEVTSIDIPQKFSVDWTQVQTNSSDAIIYETDTDADGNYDTHVSRPAILTGEELEAPETSDYIYPSKTISFSSGQQSSISSYYTIVGNLGSFGWGEDIPFTTSGEGNPTVNSKDGGFRDR